MAMHPIIPEGLFQKTFCFCYTLTTKELILKQNKKDNYVEMAQDHEIDADYKYRLQAL